MFGGAPLGPPGAAPPLGPLPLGSFPEGPLGPPPLGPPPLGPSGEQPPSLQLDLLGLLGPPAGPALPPWRLGQEPPPGGPPPQGPAPGCPVPLGLPALPLGLPPAQQPLGPLEQPALGPLAALPTAAGPLAAPSGPAAELAAVLTAGAAPAAGGGASDPRVRPPSHPPPEAAPRPPSHPPPEVAPSPPSRPPPAEEKPAEAAKKRRRGVEGLASSRNIKNGGSVTVYAGYSAVTGSAQQAATPATSSAAVLQSANKAAPAPTAGVAKEALSRQLPDGWEMKRSRTTGRVYYVNEKEGKSQFDPPAGSTIKTETRKKQRASLRSKDGLDARLTDQNGVTGLVRAKDAKAGRWAKWQQVSNMLNEESEDDKG